MILLRLLPYLGLLMTLRAAWRLAQAPSFGRAAFLAFWGLVASHGFLGTPLLLWAAALALGVGLWLLWPEWQTEGRVLKLVDAVRAADELTWAKRAEEARLGFIALGPRAAPYVAAQLGSPNPWVRRMAAFSLAHIGDVKAITALGEAVRRFPELETAWIQALADRVGAAALPTILPRVASADGSVRDTAMKAAIRFGTKDALAAVARSLAAGNEPTDWSELAESLIAHGRLAFALREWERLPVRLRKALVDAVEEPHTPDREPILGRALADANDEVAKWAAEAVREDDRGLRAQADAVLERLRRESADAPALWERDPGLASRVPDLARAHVDKARSLFEIDLAYDAASFARLDQMIERGWPDSRPSLLEPTVVVFGAYVGETLRRLHGGEWVFRPGEGLVVENLAGRGIRFDPFGMVEDRFLADGRLADAYAALLAELD